MSSNIKMTLRYLTLKPFRIITTGYSNWSKLRPITHEIQETHRKIAEAADEDLTHFHNELWGHWSDAVQHVREHIRREETFYE